MFQFNYKIQEEDINYGGHVGNERALLIFPILSSLFCQFFLDDSIVIKITEIEFSKTSFNIKYEIFNENDEKVINGSTLLVCFDYSTHRIKRVPNSFKEKCLEIIEEK